MAISDTRGSSLISFFRDMQNSDKGLEYIVSRIIENTNQKYQPISFIALTPQTSGFGTCTNPKLKFLT